MGAAASAPCKRFFAVVSAANIRRNFHKVSPCDWPEVAVALVRRTSISPPSIRWRVASLILHARYAGTNFREHAPSENIRLLQQPSVITGMFTPTVFAT
jgi:hypothetical protein